MRYFHGRPAIAAPAGSHQVLAIGGGAGLAHFLVRLFIWHEIWRLIDAVWRIHTFGPIIVIVVVVALVGLTVVRRRTGRWPVRLPGRRQGGSTGIGTGTRPREW